jgi:hypothetical protein
MPRARLALLALVAVFLILPGAVISQSAQPACVITAYAPVAQDGRLVSGASVVCSTTAERTVELIDASANGPTGKAVGVGEIIADEPFCQSTWSTLTVGAHSPPYTTRVRVIEAGVTVAEATVRTGDPGGHC